MEKTYGTTILRNTSPQKQAWKLTIPSWKRRNTDPNHQFFWVAMVLFIGYHLYFLNEKLYGIWGDLNMIRVDDSGSCHSLMLLVIDTNGEEGFWGVVG